MNKTLHDKWGRYSKTKRTPTREHRNRPHGSHLKWWDRPKGQAQAKKCVPGVRIMQISHPVHLPSNRTRYAPCLPAHLLESLLLSRQPKIAISLSRSRNPHPGTHADHRRESHSETIPFAIPHHRKSHLKPYGSALSK